MTDETRDTDKGDWHTVKRAAVLLDVSERTIWRRVKRGELSIERGKTPHLVDISDALTDSGGEPSQERPRSVSELQGEIERLRELLSEVRSERDYLRSAHATALTTSQRLLEHIEEPAADQTDRGGLLQRVGRWLVGDR